MNGIIIFLVSFCIVYIIYYLLVIRKQDKLEKFKKSTEVMYLKKVYKIKITKFDMKWLSKRIVFANSIIISVTAFIAALVNHVVVMMLLGFVVLFPTILVCYHILGIYLKKKQKEMKA